MNFNPNKTAPRNHKSARVPSISKFGKQEGGRKRQWATTFGIGIPSAPGREPDLALVPAPLAAATEGRGSRIAPRYFLHCRFADVPG